ncbi:MAG: hyaluronan synthase [Hyphococcus sp.]|nr:MAG: hyaluronan synthase [Marinicaulis sp.]
MGQSTLTLKQLRCLLAVSETNHFRRAAEQCEISQPSLSAQIQNLEEVLGLRLVERSRSGVALSPVGREIVTRARRIADEAQGILDFAGNAQSGLAGTIRLGSKPTLGPYLLPHVVARLHRKHKDLRLYVRETAPRELEFELANGLHDVVLSQLPATSSEHVAEELFQEPLYLALAVDHPLAKKEKLTVNSLSGLEILSLSPEYHLHDQINALCQDFGATLLRDYEGTSLDALRQMVGMGMGVTFLPALYVHSEISSRAEIVVKPLRGRSITRPIGLIWRKSAGRAQSYKKIANIIRDVAKAKFKDLIIT